MALGFDNPLKPKGFQSLNPRIRDMISKMNLQQKSRFDFLIFRTPFEQEKALTGASGLATVGAAGLGLAADLYMSKVHVQSISFAPTRVTYERISGDTFAKDVEYSDTITIKFLDDEKGLCMRYLQDWFQAVMVPSSVTSARKGYVFRDDQEAARRTGILLLAPASGKFPPTYPRITFYGLVPKEIQEITVGQEEKDNLTYDVQFSVRDIRITRAL